MSKLYVAYGSNMNLEQMAYRCPAADLVGVGSIPDYELEFHGVATIVPKVGRQVPAVIWRISEVDEKRLDIYEGYPKLYRKELLQVRYNSKIIECMAYTLKAHHPARPSDVYLHCILQGYQQNKINVQYLMDVLNK